MRLFGETEGVGRRGNKWVDIPDLIPVAPECPSSPLGSSSKVVRRVRGTKGGGLQVSLAHLGTTGLGGVGLVSLCLLVAQEGTRRQLELTVSQCSLF